VMRLFTVCLKSRRSIGGIFLAKQTATRGGGQLTTVNTSRKKRRNFSKDQKFGLK